MFYTFVEVDFIVFFLIEGMNYIIQCKHIAYIIFQYLYIPFVWLSLWLSANDSASGYGILLAVALWPRIWSGLDGSGGSQTFMLFWLG